MGTALQNTGMSVPIGNLEAYIARVQQIPLLAPEEEHDLAVRFYENHDLDAARKMIMAHLRFVVKIARNYRGYGLPLNDLIQEGSVGLMKAVKRFNPYKGVKLVTFAIHWIKAEIHEFILKNWKIVKIATTKAQRKLFFNLRSLKKHLNWLSNKEVDDIAETLDVHQTTVREMEARLQSSDASLDLTPEDEAYHGSSDYYLEDQSSNPALIMENSNWESDQQQQLQQACAKLDARSQEIIQARWLDENKATLQELAAKYHVSAERIRQIEQEAFKKIRGSFSIED